MLPDGVKKCPVATFNVFGKYRLKKASRGISPFLPMVAELVLEAKALSTVASKMFSS